MWCAPIWSLSATSAMTSASAITRQTLRRCRWMRTTTSLAGSRRCCCCCSLRATAWTADTRAVRLAPDRPENGRLRRLRNRRIARRRTLAGTDYAAVIRPAGVASATSPRSSCPRRAIDSPRQTVRRDGRCSVQASNSDAIEGPSDDANASNVWRSCQCEIGCSGRGSQLPSWTR